MTRPTLLPSRSHTPSSPPGAAAPSSEFARWLTHDLRIKGAMGSESPLSSSSIPAPPSAPPTIELAVDERPSDFALWLSSDLRPRGSNPPDSLAPQLLPAHAAPADAVSDGAHGDAEALQSEARQSEALQSLPPPIGGALGVGAADAEGFEFARPSADVVSLDDDDLAVLPMRASRFLAAKRRQRSLGVAALCALIALCSWSFCGVRSASDIDVQAAAAQALPPPPGALPPPPPDFVAMQDEVMAEDSVAPARSRGVRAEEPEVLDDAEIWRRGGPNVRRFADLPLPTLSKLAREENERLRERDATVRKQPKTTASAH